MRALVITALALLLVHSSIRAGDSTTPSTTAPTTKPVEAKPLSQHVKKGLDWLAKQQQADGGWNQGESSADKGRSGEIIDKSNVADTCMAALTFVRSGSTPSKGDHAENVLKALDFVCGQIEKSSQEGLFITDIKGTRVQTKIGQYVDTFAVALLLAEVKDTMPDDAGRKRVIAALDKVMDKIEKNQKEDGRWVDANDGWAGALSQSIGHKAINKAAQSGYAVKDKVLTRSERFANSGISAGDGSVAMGGSAGIELYARASNIQALKESDATNRGREEKLRAIVASPASQPAQAKEAMMQLEQIAETRAQLAVAEDVVVKRLDDKQFVAGFGNNGGEEFLSYMNIGEALVAKAGAEWEKWDQSMTENLNRVQNEDGSWSGHHCITGRTFCTSAALMTLMTDRAVTMTN